MKKPTMTQSEIEQAEKTLLKGGIATAVVIFGGMIAFDTYNPPQKTGLDYGDRSKNVQRNRPDESPKILNEIEDTKKQMKKKLQSPETN